MMRPPQPAQDFTELVLPPCACAFRFPVEFPVWPAAGLLALLPPPTVPFMAVTAPSVVGYETWARAAPKLSWDEEVSPDNGLPDADKPEAPWKLPPSTDLRSASRLDTGCESEEKEKKNIQWTIRHYRPVNLLIYWTPMVAIMPTLSSLVTPQVVITTYQAADDDKLA